MSGRIFDETTGIIPYDSSYFDDVEVTVEVRRCTPEDDDPAGLGCLSET